MTSVLSSVAPSLQKPPLSQTHPYTCNACQVAFRNNDQQRTHYHTDWHQYNVKRKVASLPPLSSETFAEKVLSAQASNRLERERASFEKNCSACNKVYYSQNAYANHLGSMRHKQNASSGLNNLRAGGNAFNGTGKSGRVIDDKDETASVVSSTFSLGDPVATTVEVDAIQNQSHRDKESEIADAEFANVVKGLKISDDAQKKDTTAPSGEEVKASEEEPTELALEACLYCSYVSPSLELNVSHMTKAHGLFIPERSFLVDLEGLIRYLGKKLLLGNQCLYCNKTKGGLEGVRTHMKDKGHTMLGFESEEQQVELGQFYDFRSSYSDVEEHEGSGDEGETEPKQRGLKPNYIVRKEGEVDDEWEGVSDGGWETDSSASSLDSTELCAVPIDQNGHSHKHHGKSERHHMQDGWHSHAHSRAHVHAVYHDDYELHLPSGRSVGHRSLNRYYRQNLRDHPLNDKEVRRIADTPYPRSGDETEFVSDDEEDGGVVVALDSTATPSNRRRSAREEKRLALISRANGGLGMLGVSNAKKKEVSTMEKRSRDMDQRGRKRYEWGTEKRSNKQKHYRDPLLQ